MLIDTHAHLTSRRLRNKIDDILARSHESGVEKIISIACDLKDSREVIALAGRYGEIFATAGIHPSYVHEIESDDWPATLRKLARENPVVAIGEVGLDYFHPPPDAFTEASWRALQARVFEEQLAIAQELNLPVVVHQRNSGDDVLDILKNFPSVTAVLHCFTGTIEQAERALELGNYLSFTGVVTYPKAPEVREAARFVPSDRFMVETDSPYLAPVPYRGKSNEPAYVRYVAEEIAKVRQIPTEECASLATANSEVIFGLTVA